MPPLSVLTPHLQHNDECGSLGQTPGFCLWGKAVEREKGNLSIFLNIKVDSQNSLKYLESNISFCSKQACKKCSSVRERARQLKAWEGHLSKSAHIKDR